jgi:hemerythrin-like domain-containing protein
MSENIPESNELDPTDELRNDHRIIERVLQVLRVLIERARDGQGFESESFGRAVEFFRLFADACHHAKEEDLLFPVLEARGIPRQGGPIGVMLEEHRQARRLTEAMATALTDLASDEQGAKERFLSAAGDYQALLAHHIFKEDNVLFRIGDQVLSESDQKSLSLEFCDVRCRAFDGKTREQLEVIADELESRWVRTSPPDSE